MREKLIENFIKSRGGDCKQRIERDGGGQYLVNFLKEFASFVKEETLIGVQKEIKKMRDL